MLLEVSGAAGPDAVWSRYVTPSHWPTWAPQIRAVSAGDSPVRVGDTGQVAGPGPVAVDYRIVAVDEVLRSWSWDVEIGRARVRMDHAVVPTAAGGSRALLQVLGPAAVPVQAYRPVARRALEQLVGSAGSLDPDPEPVQRFDFAFSPAYAVAARPFGVTPRSAWVELGPRWLYVRYGPWKLLTPRSNVRSAQVTGDFSFAKTAGPAHLSLKDRGVSMTRNGDRAVCLEFAEPVVAIDTTGALRHPGATLSVADPEALVTALVG